MRFDACLALAISGVASAYAGAAPEWRFEVAAGAPRVVSCAVGRDWPSLMERFDVAAMDADGVARPVPWALDATGEQPELVFLADGHRSFELLPKAGNAVPPVPKMARDRPRETIVKRHFAHS